MFTQLVRRATMPAFMAFVSLLAAPSQAQDRDTKEISAYVLTEEALAKYAQATRNLNATARQVPANCEDEGEGGPSINQLVARINAEPKAKAAIQSTGLTIREYLVFGFSVFQTGLASWSLSQPGGKLPPGVSMANVQFYRKHETAIQKIKPASSECDGTGGEEKAEDY